MRSTELTIRWLNYARGFDDALAIVGHLSDVVRIVLHWQCEKDNILLFTRQRHTLEKRTLLRKLQQ